MKFLLEKLGQDPKRSLTLFMRGLGLFVIGAGLIALGYFSQPLWQIPGLVLLGLGILFAAWGYLGIFSNRLLVMLSRSKDRNIHKY